MASSLYSIVIFLIIIISLAASVQGAYLKYKDPRQPVEARIKDLMTRMSLAEKIGQITQIDRLVATDEVMRKYFIGSVITVDTSVPGIQGSDKNPYNNSTAETWVNTINEIQKVALSTPLGIPMLYAVDAIHGHNYAYNATIFPHNIGLGVTRDPELVQRIGAVTAIEVRATGVRYVFAPPLAVCRDPRWGRCYESYSEDPNIVRQMTEIITGLQGNIPANTSRGVPFVAHDKTKVAACAKQYVGEGGTTNGIDKNNTVISREGLMKIHMPPYIDAIDKGIVISDWLGIDRITTPEHANFSTSIKAAMLAGIDMAMVPYNFEEFIRDLTYQEHRELAREAVRKSLVLLKNEIFGDRPMLPLQKKAKKILVAGSHAHNLGLQCGGWTIDWYGRSGNNLTSGTTIIEGVTNTVDPSTKVVYNENPDVNFAPYVEKRGDSLNLTIPANGISTIENVCGVLKCVVILITGRPVVIQPYLAKIDALVAAWLPGTEGQGVSDVLFGDYGFTGKLARTWFKSVDQLPMNVGDKHYDPLFPFGFGLTTQPTHSNKL
ncbi:Beta-glucosidase BoGH3B [Linum perenne]